MPAGRSKRADMNETDTNGPRIEMADGEAAGGRCFDREWTDDRDRLAEVIRCGSNF